MNINSLTINSSADKIEVSVAANTGYLVTQVLFWTKDTFKDYSKAIDLSNLLSQTINTENFHITPADVGLESFDGIFFLEFNSSEPITVDSCGNIPNIGFGLVANYTKYYECVLNRVLALDIKGCKEVTSEDCEECSDNLLYINSLLTGLEAATKLGFYEEAIKILESLEELCEDCDSCPDYENTTLLNGYGFGTFDNSIIIA